MLHPNLPRKAWQPVLLLSGLTVWGLLVHGYHPFAEDGGVYMAGIEKLLRPTLFPAFTAFTTEHLRFSFFAPIIVGLVRGLHLPLPTVLLTAYIFSVFATLAGGYSLLSRVTSSFAARAGGVVLLSSAMTVPVAGTSLILIDPYLTARSVSTPLCLFALAFTFDLLRGTTRASREKSALWIALLLASAAAVHPLMAAYGLAAVVMLVVASLTHRRQQVLVFAQVFGLALLVAGCVQAFAPPDSTTYTWVAMTRYYWFPFRWHWYEQLGLIGPLIVLALLSQAMTLRAAAVARAGCMLGAISTAVATLFCRAHFASHLVSRLQPLRCFSTIYLLMLLLLGAWLGERWMRAHAWRWAVMLIGLGGLMFFVQRNTFPASSHLELPGRTTTNSWVQSFLWIREHTPEDALFALDAHYIGEDGEDAQCFRAIAQRSALPDYSKDGGEASITPELTPAWIAGQLAQTGLNRDTDDQRRASLVRFGVTWIVLRADSRTMFDCPYRNAAVQVCRLP